MTRQVLENMHMIPSLLIFFFNVTFLKLIQPTHSSPSPTPSPLSNVLSMPLRELIFAWFPPSAHIVGWDHTYGSEERLLIQGEFGPQTNNISIILDLGPIPHLWNQRPLGKGPASCVQKALLVMVRTTALAHRSVVKLMSAQGRNTESSFIQERDSIDSLENIS